jgi:dGTP triphosphohydrolase
MAVAGGFDHNAHSIRLVTKLETPYPDFEGLNLSWETLEGLAKHNGPVLKPSWALAEANEAFDLELGSLPSLEAQVGNPRSRSAGSLLMYRSGVAVDRATCTFTTGMMRLGTCWKVR